MEQMEHLYDVAVNGGGQISLGKKDIRQLLELLVP